VVRAALVSAFVALVVPVSAQAALSFAFDRALARPGQIVRAFQADSDGNPAPGWGKVDGVTIYLVRVRNPSGPRVPLGPMGIDALGVWSITFRTPSVKPGLYTTAFFCRPCGNTFFPSTLAGTPWSGEPGRVLKIRATAPHS
jgi:hypothetical protein